MSVKSKKDLNRKIIIAVCVLIAVVIVIWLFANSKNLPKVEKLYEFFGISPGISETDDFVRVMDVGQGDGILICSNGLSAVIDTGTPELSDEFCKDIYSLGINKLDLIMLSHFHDDHSGGIEFITDRFPTYNLIIPDIMKSDCGSGYPKVSVMRVKQNKGEIYLPVQGMCIELGDFDITVLGYYSDIDDENNRSIFAMAEIDNKRFLFTGDAETEAEKRLLEDSLNIDCDVLKVGHHGSNSSSSKKFLKACMPEFAAISCGKDNSYSHPHKETIERLNDLDTRIYRTDISGDITFYVENGDIRVETER